MSREMTKDEWRAFVLESTRTGKLATVRRDGRPHVVPIWFVLDGDDFVFTTGSDSLKAKAIRRDPRVALCVDDEAPPFAFVLAEGTAALSEDLDDVLRFATAIGGRYMGQERAGEFGRRNAVPGEVLVRLTPDKVVARAGISDSEPSPAGGGVADAARPPKADGSGQDLTVAGPETDAGGPPARTDGGTP
jgi:PPOX class probable F420-dependent enzyme